MHSVQASFVRKVKIKKSLPCVKGGGTKGDGGIANLMFGAITPQSKIFDFRQLPYKYGSLAGEWVLFNQIKPPMFTG